MLEELTASTQTVTAGSTEEYAAYLEEKLKKMLEAVQGLGEVEVMVTLESSEEKIVEKDMTAERSNTEEQDAAGGARTVIPLIQSTGRYTGRIREGILLS